MDNATIALIVLAFCVVGICLVAMACFEQAEVADARWDEMMDTEARMLAHTSAQIQATEAWLAEQDYGAQEVDA